jgi:hypothetical protein
MVIEEMTGCSSLFTLCCSASYAHPLGIASVSRAATVPHHALAEQVVFRHAIIPAHEVCIIFERKAESLWAEASRAIRLFSVKSIN